MKGKIEHKGNNSWKENDEYIRVQLSIDLRYKLIVVPVDSCIFIK